MRHTGLEKCTLDFVQCLTFQFHTTLQNQQVHFKRVVIILAVDTALDGKDTIQFWLTHSLPTNLLVAAVRAHQNRRQSCAVQSFYQTQYYHADMHFHSSRYNHQKIAVQHAVRCKDAHTGFLLARPKPLSMVLQIVILKSITNKVVKKQSRVQRVVYYLHPLHHRRVMQHARTSIPQICGVS